MVSPRCLKVGEEVRRVLADILQQGIFHMPGLDAYFVTVTEVRMSSDLRLAKVFIFPLGFAYSETVMVIKLLDMEKPFLRRKLGQKIHLKFIPELTFRADKTFDTSSKIDSLLGTKKVRKDVERDR